MKSVKRPEITSISFRPAKGGMISETSMRKQRGGQGGGPDWDHHTESAVHPTMEHAMSHMRKSMGHCFGPEK